MSDEQTPSGDSVGPESISNSTPVEGAPVAGDAGGTAGGATADEAGAADDELAAAAEAVEGDLAVLASERDQFLDAYRRAQADFDNYRKQAQKRQDDAVVRALGNFVENLLPVLDSCDAAMTLGAGEAVEPILTALYGALEREGLERLDPKGEPFDPAIAEAVVHEPGQGGEHVVAEVLRTGYRWRGRILRPAMVKVTD